MLNNVLELFESDVNKGMTWVAFEQNMQRPEMIRYFEHLDVDWVLESHRHPVTSPTSR